MPQATDAPAPNLSSPIPDLNRAMEAVEDFFRRLQAELNERKKAGVARVTGGSVNPEATILANGETRS